MFSTASNPTRSWPQATIRINFSIRIESLLTLSMALITMLACGYWGLRLNLNPTRYIQLTLLGVIISLVATLILFRIGSFADRFRTKEKAVQNRTVDWRLMVRCLAFFVPLAWLYSHMKAGLFVGENTTWDLFFHRLDLLLLAGHDPVVCARAWVPEAAIGVFSVVYKLFIFVMMGSIIWLVLAGRKERARRLTAALVIGYYVGVLSYHVAPSYGPAYTIASASCESYCPSIHQIQMILLNHVNGVLESPATATVEPWVYIGAFPSLHVSHTLILAWYFRYSRVGFSIQILFAILTAIATILFGWHFLIDWIGGILVAAASIRLAGIGRFRITYAQAE